MTGAEQERRIPDEYVAEIQTRADRIVMQTQSLLDETFDVERAKGALESMRIIHAIARHLSLESAARLAGESRDLLEAIARTEIVAEDDNVEILQAACDALASMTDPGGDEDFDSLLDQLRDAAGKRAAPSPSESSQVAVIDWPAAATDLSADLVRQFAVEAYEHLQAIEAGLLKLEADPAAADSLAEVFRAIHSIKGTADYVGLAQIKCLSHQLETVLDLARGGNLRLTDGIMSLVFAGVDELGGMIGELDEAGEALHRSVTTLKSAASYMQQNAFIEPCDAIDSWLEMHDEDACPEGIEELASLSNQLDALLDQVQAEVDGVAPVAAPTRKQPVSAPESSRSKDPKAVTTRAESSAAGRSIRVDQIKLDEYINLAGELVIARNALAHVFAGFQDEAAETARPLKSAIESVDRIAGSIQENAMAMRMVPVKTVFQRFPRVVRDIARTQEKSIELQMFGEETEIDKQVAEALGDPLVHLVRNSADHGVESPDVRRAAGKSETGLVTLRAGREGNSVVIDIIDDGGGIDADRLKAKAVENGLMTAQQAEAMPHQEALQLIFAAGLSTAAKVTNVSGRGVGMDVVRTNIQSLGGTVTVSSEAGEGTQLRIKLPLTLAVTTGLLVDSGDQAYALPLDVIQETVKVDSTDIRIVGGEPAITLRDQIVPVRSLHALLGGRSSKREPGQRPGPNANSLPTDATGRVPIVVVQIGGLPFGLAVDAVRNQQEIVLKPLPGFLAQLPGLGSATVMGDGSIVLILDPNTLYQQLLNRSVAKTVATTPR